MHGLEASSGECCWAVERLEGRLEGLGHLVVVGRLVGAVDPVAEASVVVRGQRAAYPRHLRAVGRDVGHGAE